MITLRLIFMLLAVVFFALAAFSFPTPPRVNLIAAGLFFWALATMISV